MKIIAKCSNCNFVYYDGSLDMCDCSPEFIISYKKMHTTTLYLKSDLDGCLMASKEAPKWNKEHLEWESDWFYIECSDSLNDFFDSLELSNTGRDVYKVEVTARKIIKFKPPPEEYSNE